MAKAVYASYGVKAPDKPVTEQIDPRQVKNSAGGYVYQLSDMARLNRFLILGSDTNTYYAGKQELTKQNADCVTRCFAHDAIETARMIADVSQSGRAPKNDPALFALAIGASHSKEHVRREAFMVLPEVARTASHLFAFIAYCQSMRSLTGRMFKDAIADWYNTKPVAAMVYQMVKYRERSGFSHEDAINLSHVSPRTREHDLAFSWAIGKLDIPDTEPAMNDPLGKIWAFEKAKGLQDNATDKRTLLHLIEDWGLTREMVPTWFLKDPEVWEALLVSMPMEAMLRNIVNMSECGLLRPMSAATHAVTHWLTDADRVRKARLHPLKVLSAIKAYEAADVLHDPQTAKALEAAMEHGFSWIPKTGKRWLLALDVSGSMASGHLAGVHGVTPREGSAVMAMVTARNEENYFIGGFTNQFVPIKITDKDSYSSALKKISDLPFGGTNLALPFTFAKREGLDVDVFASYTDNETWDGGHIKTAIRQYRSARVGDARSIVVGMTATHFTIADPDDPRQMDVAGFDTDAPQVLAMFAMGEI